MADDQGTALTVAEGQELTPVTMFNALMRAATDPRVDPGKMTALAELQIRMIDYRKQEEFNQDKAAAVLEMPVIDKRGRVIIPAKDGKPQRLQSRYSKWEDIHAAIMPILEKHRLVISHNVGHQGNLVTVTPILTHKNGFVEMGGEMALPIDNSGSKNPTQGVGSACSYGQRYSSIMMLNIRQMNADDDGQATGPTASHLSEAESDLADLAADAAKRGAAAYMEWFQSLSSAEKGWLVFTGRHGQHKTATGAA